MSAMKQNKSTHDPGCIQQFKNCLQLRDHELMREDLWIRDGIILNPEKLFFEEQLPADIQYDCQDSILAPGLIDTQINGAIGVDFSLNANNIEEDVAAVAKELLSHGVTSFCPTIVTSPPSIYHQILPRIQKTNGSRNGAGILGVHLEGPFISKEKHGAHPKEYVRGFDNGFQDLLTIYGHLDHAAIVTLAPEYNHSDDVIKELAQRDIVVSLGHSTANLVQGENAVCNGASFITHLFNAMLPFHHRDPHLIGLLTSKKLPAGKTIFYGLIADGIHTHPAALRIAHRVHPKGLVLVTDAIPGLGLPPGEYTLGQMKVEIKNGRATLLGTDALCGSIATLNQCVRNFYRSTGCSKVEALEAASLHPAQLLKLTERKGTLNYGTDADFLLLDDALNLQATFIAGEKVWDKAAEAKNSVIKIL